MKKMLLAIFFISLLIMPMVLAKDDSDKIDKKLDKVMDKVGYVNYKLKVHGTEYIPNQTAKLWIQLLDNYKPVENTTCFISIYKPDNTLWVNNSIMIPTNKGDGIQYYDFVTPYDEGVYMSSVKCNMPKIAFIDDLNDMFNIYNFDSIIIENGEIEIDSSSKTGYAITKNIKLEGYNWEDLYVSYNNFTYLYPNNYLDIKLYSSNNTLLCNITQEDTNIKNCAGTEPYIYLRFDLGRDKIGDISPRVFKYYLTWNTTQSQELRGSGEVHITDVAKNITSTCNPKEVWKYFYINPINESVDFNLIYILLTIIIILSVVIFWRR